MILDKDQKNLLKSWMTACKLVYNQGMSYLNEHQGFSELGEAKGSKEQQFKTLSMRTWVTTENIPAKLIHSTLQRCYGAWSTTKCEKGTKVRLGSYADKNFTLSTDPLAYKRGTLYPKFWGKLNPFELRYKHKNVCLTGHNCLTISIKYGRFYLSQPNEYTRKEVKTDSVKVIALDPGLRNFLTGFDGTDWLTFTTPEDAQRLVKIARYADKLVKLKKSTKDGEHHRKINFKISRLRRKLGNLKKELINKTASWLSQNYDVVFCPEFEVQSMFVKGKNNKTNNRVSRLLSHYEFRAKLAYHCAKNGSVMVKVNEAYSSKTCSHCGHVHTKLGSKKVFDCPSCGHQIDRDLNGATNIFLNSLMLSQGGLGY